MTAKSDIITAPIVTYARHRIGCDGEGVTTLVCFHGCPLRCKMCINPFSFDEKTKRVSFTPEQLYEKLKIDNLYFLATGGGITFGGGEPLLYPDFLIRFKEICPAEWHNCVETSLNVPWDNVKKATAAIDRFIVDCKDTDPLIYKNYTGKDNAAVMDNLKRLIDTVDPKNITVRVPLITNYNTETDRDRSIALLKKMGIINFDKFTYVDPVNRKGLFKQLDNKT